MSVEKIFYGKMNNNDVYAFIIENANGAKAHIIEKGATLEKLFISDKDGKFIDVLVGHDNLEAHIKLSDYQGVIVGQYANRIKDGRFSIDGVEYNVTRNEKGMTCLHGGGEYNNALWCGKKTSDNAVEFSYLSTDGKEGFPGNVSITVTYTLTDKNDLIIDYKAVSDKKTIINLTNHAFFNLNGFDSGDILSHTLQINADRFTAIDEFSIPTGELPCVTGTPFDFTSPKAIGRDINEDNIQLKNGMGYDHNFCITEFDGTLKTAAIATGDKSGIVMEVKTDLPGIQLYTGNFLDGSINGKNGAPITHRNSFCLETQVYPDTPNHPEWPGCIYDDGEEYNTKTIFSFSVAR